MLARTRRVTRCGLLSAVATQGAIAQETATEATTEQGTRCDRTGKFDARLALYAQKPTLVGPGQRDVLLGQLMRGEAGRLAAF